MPTAFALTYLKTINKLHANQKSEGVKTLESGYELRLGSKLLRGNNFGGISKWGSSDDKAHLETTAFILKFLNAASQYVEVDFHLIVEMLNFLKQRQRRDGSFMEQELSQEADLNVSPNSVDLTAFVVICIQENLSFVRRYQHVIDAALEYISAKLKSIENEYTLAICAYALSLNQHTNAVNFLRKLKEKEKTLGDQSFWDGATDGIKVETAAYAILAQVKLEDLLKARYNLNWLQSQRNERGGFYSVRDTIIGLQAISAMGKHLYTEHFNVDLLFFNNYSRKLVKITNQNKMEVKQLTFPNSESFSVQANGTGVAYIHAWQTFTRNSNDLMDQFAVDVNATLNNSNTLKIEICLNNILNHILKLSVVEISVPTGFDYLDVVTASTKFKVC